MSPIPQLQAELWPFDYLTTTENRACDALASDLEILTKVGRILHTNRSTDEVEHDPHTLIMSRVMALWFLKIGGKLYF